MRDLRGALRRFVGAEGPENTLKARWKVLHAGYGARPTPADPADVRAMQMVLRIEKRTPPARSAVLAASASSAVALCLDERCGPGGEWEGPLREWADESIRKVTRRARGKQWQDVQQVPGVTVESGGAQVRAFVPGRVGDIDPRVKKLQISGTDLVDDAPGEPDPALPVIWLDAALPMSTGKAAAQVGHGSMLLAGAMGLGRVRRWAEAGFACSVRYADAGTWARLTDLERKGEAVAVRDAGFTEIAPGSMTVIAVPGGL